MACDLELRSDITLKPARHGVSVQVFMSKFSALSGLFCYPLVSFSDCVFPGWRSGCLGGHPERLLPSTTGAIELSDLEIQRTNHRHSGAVSLMTCLTLINHSLTRRWYSLDQMQQLSHGCSYCERSMADGWPFIWCLKGKPAHNFLSPFCA